MSKITFKYCALQYLNQWLDRDSTYCETLSNEAASEEDKLECLAKSAAFYKIARNLPEKFDKQQYIPRYKPLLSIIESQKQSSFSGASLVNAILSVEREISKQYGNRKLLSLTTKVLWLKFRSPIIIYDSRARATLRVKGSDLGEYYKQWNLEYRKHEDEIAKACDSLKDVWEYTSNIKVANSTYVMQTAEQQWFKERVFDIYLWSRGNEE